MEINEAIELKKIIEQLKKELEQLKTRKQELISDIIKEQNYCDNKILHTQIRELESTNARLQSENSYLKEVIAAPAKPRYAQLLGENARLREALTGLLELGRKDTNNSKYDSYYETARAALTVAFAQHNWSIHPDGDTVCDTCFAVKGFESAACVPPAKEKL